MVDISKDVTSGKVFFLSVTGFYSLKCWGYRLIFQIMPIFKKVQSKNPVKGPNLGSEELGVLCCQCFWQLGSE